MKWLKPFHGRNWFRDVIINVGCLMSRREFLIVTEREREEIRIQKDDLEREREELEAKEQESRDALQNDNNAAETRYREYHSEMNELSRRRVKESLQLLETTRQAAVREMYQHSFSGHSHDYLMEGGKISKPPTFPTFSGIELTPKDECSIQTFLFQVRSAHQDMTDQAV